MVLVAHAPSGTVGLYVNAQLVGLMQGLSSWSMSSQTMRFGKVPEFNGTPGFVSRVKCYKGTSVPRPGTMGCLLAVEDSLYEDAALVPGACSASFMLDSSLADNINGNPSFSLVGVAAAAGAYPGGATPKRPWEW